MFKKLYEKIELIYEQMNRVFKLIDCSYSDINTNMKVVRDKTGYIPEINSMQNTIESQQRTIEQLTNALKDKYEHGLFVISNNGRIPMVIRNGKELTNEMTSYFGIDWTRGESPHISIEQFAGTCHDLEV